MKFSTIGGLLFLALATSASASQWANPDVEFLWQQVAADVGHDRSSWTANEVAGTRRAAAELLMQAESGQLELTARDRERLDWVLAQPPAFTELNPVVSGPSATITGEVTEEGTGLPVTTGSVNAIPFGIDTFNSFSAPIQPDGSYTLVIPPGQYVLQTNSHADHVREAWPDLTCVDPNICSPWYGGDVIDLASGASLIRDFELARGIRISGTVSDSSLAPVSNAVVYLSARNRSYSIGISTAPDGSYMTARALPPGDYRVFAQGPSGSGLLGKLHDGQLCATDCRELPVAYLTLSNTATPSVVNFQLDPGVGLSGTVYEEDGVTPLEGASVQLASTDGWTSASQTTDASGNYQFESLRPADYRILAQHAETLNQIHPGLDCFGFDCAVEIGTPVALGGSPQVIDFTLQPGSSVSGTIRRLSDGTPVENAWVSVSNSLQGGRSSTTDASGNFTVTGLVEGTFFVYAHTEDELERTYLGNVNCPLTNCGDFGTPLSVPASGGVSAVDIDMAVGGGLSGQLFDGQTGATLGFVFVPRLELWVSSGPYAGQLAAQGLSDEFGNYQISGLKPGAYKATFGTSSHLGLIDTAFGGQPCPRGSCDLSLLPTVFVTAGTVLPGISATLPRGPVISGTVTDSVSGQAPPWRPGTSRLMAFYGASGNYASFSAVDGEGHYRSRTGFPAGTFYVSSYIFRNDMPFGDNYIDQAYNNLDCPRLQCNLTSAATALNVAGTDLDSIDFSLRKGGAIEGNIRDDGTSLGLAGVGIEAYDSLGRLVAKASSDALGNYRLDSLPTGDYFVRTRNLSGYQDQLHAGQSCTPFCDPVTGTTVAVAENAVVNNLDFDLIQSAAISGTVELSGSPAANITVEVYGAIGNLLDSTLSASDGSFAFTSLAPGDFYLRTRNSFGHADVLFDSEPCVGNACQVRRGLPITLAPGSSVAGLTLELTPGATISGEVHDRLSPSTKLSGVRVQLLDERGAVAFESTTGVAGSFSFPALAAGDYHLVTRETPGYVDQTLGGTACPSACNGLNGTLVSVASGATVSGQNLDLAPGASISGNVTAGGSPAVGAIAQVYNDSGVPVYQQPTNPSGNYEINQLPDGDFHVRVGNVPGYVSQLWNAIACSGYCDVLSGDQVTISGSTSVGSVNFVLAAGGGISGQVSSGTGPLPAVEVVAWDNAGFIAGRGVSNALGEYSINGLVAGNYKVRTTNTGGYIDQVFGGSSCSPSPCLLSAGSAITVASTTVAGIDFALTAGGSISGTATDQFGNPLPDGTATLMDVNGIELDTDTIEDGLWNFSGLADGTYYLLIENNLGLVDELYAGVPCPAGACDITDLGTPIVVGGGRLLGAGNAGIAVALSRGVSVSGRVTDLGSGSAIVGAAVYFRDASGKLAGQGVTDGLGDYQSLGGLPPGQYFVSTASGTMRGVESNYVNQLFDGVPCPMDCNLGDGSPVTVAAEPVTGIDFALAQGAGLSGLVTGPGNAGLIQVEVRLFDADGYLAGTWRSNSQGQYAIDGLPAGTYYAHTVNNLGLADVTFGNDPCDGQCDPLAGQAIVVPANGTAGNINFELDFPDQVFADRFE